MATKRFSAGAGRASVGGSTVPSRANLLAALESDPVHVGSTTFDPASLSVSYNGRSLTLPLKEFLLAYKLASQIGRVFTREQLFNDVWGADANPSCHTLDVHISRLRRDLGNNPDCSIVTVRGVGYKMVVR